VKQRKFLSSLTFLKDRSETETETEVFPGLEIGRKKFGGGNGPEGKSRMVVWFRFRETAIPLSPKSKAKQSITEK